MTPRDSYIDETVLTAIAGDGGGGIVAFRREKFVPRGGPNGGDGGHGGDVVIVADRNLATLWDQRYMPSVRAGDGAGGGGSERTGADGDDAVARVPVGTLVYDLEEGGEGASCGSRPARPARRRRPRGRGGLGNTRFKGLTRQTPDFATPGQARRAAQAAPLAQAAGRRGAGGRAECQSRPFSRISAARPRWRTILHQRSRARSRRARRRRFVVADIPGSSRARARASDSATASSNTSEDTRPGASSRRGNAGAAGSGPAGGVRFDPARLAA
jgi:GTP-binding protein